MLVALAAPAGGQVEFQRGCGGERLAAAAAAA